MNDKKWEAVAKELSTKSIHMKSAIDEKLKRHKDSSVGRNQKLQEVNEEAKYATTKENNGMKGYDAREEDVNNGKEMSLPTPTLKNCSCTGRKDK